MGLLALSLVSASLLGAPTYRGSEAETEARAKGLVTLAETSGDFDGDGRQDAATVERDAAGRCRIVILTMSGDEDEPEFTRAHEGSQKKCDRVVKLSAHAVGGDRAPDVVAELEEKSPDEHVEHIRISGRIRGAFAELYAQSFPVPDPSQIEGLVDLGRAKPTFEVLDVDKNGELELVWVRGPQLLTLKGSSGPVNVVIGAEKQLFRFNSESQTFKKDDQTIIEDLLPPRAPWEVTASSQKPKIWGTAQPFWISDGTLTTSWAVTNKSRGAGEYIDVVFAKPTPVQLVRIVPGCAESVDAWKKGGQVTKFRLEAGTIKVEIDRDKLTPPPAGLRGVGEFPLPGGFGDQVLLLLEQPQQVRSVRLTITGVAPGSDKSPLAETCISELSLHG